MHYIVCRSAWLDQPVQPDSEVMCFSKLQDWRELGQQLSECCVAHSGGFDAKQSQTSHVVLGSLLADLSMQARLLLSPYIELITAPCRPQIDDARALLCIVGPNVSFTQYKGVWYTLFPERVNYTGRSVLRHPVA